MRAFAKSRPLAELVVAEAPRSFEYPTGADVPFLGLVTLSGGLSTPAVVPVVHSAYSESLSYRANR